MNNEFIKAKTLGEFVAELLKLDQSLPMVEQSFRVTIDKYHFDNNGRNWGYHFGDNCGCCTRAEQLNHPKPITAIRIVKRRIRNDY